LVFLKNVNRDNEYLFAKPGMKSGNTINVRYPARYVGRVGEGYSPEPYVESSYPVVIRPLQGVDIDLPSTDWTLNIDDTEERVLKPAMAQLVNNVERDCIQVAYQGTSNWVGTLNTVPTTSNVPLAAAAYLKNEAAPDDGRGNRLIISPNTNATLVPALQGLFNPQVKISSQYEKGIVGKQTLGWDWYESQNVWTHTIGPLGGTPTMTTTAGQTGSSIATTGWTASAAKRLNKGDIISIAGVNAVNPMTRAAYGGSNSGLRQFVVTADVYSDGSGNATIPIFPAIVPAPLAFATTDSTPAASALINVWSTAAAGQSAIANTTSAQCLGYHRDAYTFAGVSQQIPKGSTEMAYEATDPDTGIQLRFVRQYVATQNLFVNRFDVLYAFGVPYGQLACRMQSQ
jgi:P22 coat protein - gene protein 5